jgi:hypothetical protein
MITETELAQEIASWPESLLSRLLSREPLTIAEGV